MGKTDNKISRCRLIAKANLRSENHGPSCIKFTQSKRGHSPEFANNPVLIFEGCNAFTQGKLLVHAVHKFYLVESECCYIHRSIMGDTSCRQAVKQFNPPRITQNLPK